MDYVTQTNYSYENIFPSLRSVETLNSKFNVLEKLKNECSLEHKFIHRNNIMETIKKYYNDENLGTLSYKDPHHSIAILFADWWIFRNAMYDNSTSFHYVEFLIDYRSPTVRRFSN
jgi:hypothetical protein